MHLNPDGCDYSLQILGQYQYIFHKLFHCLLSSYESLPSILGWCYFSIPVTICFYLQDNSLTVAYV